MLGKPLRSERAAADLAPGHIFLSVRPLTVAPHPMSAFISYGIVGVISGLGLIFETLRTKRVMRERRTRWNVTCTYVSDWK